MDFISLTQKLNINLTEKQLRQFCDYFHFLVEYNEITNLTAITEENEVYIKHFYDSILLSQALDINNIDNICDIGAGAGFPSIPLKICYPNLKVTIIDSLDKRITFLSKLCDLLGLEGVTLIHGRAEEEVKNLRESFDLVTARAVARQNILNELCIPYAKIGGHFVALKGKNYAEEVEEGKSTELLGGKIKEIKEYILPEEDAKRALVIIEKIKNTPNKYPRQFGQIKKKPL